MNEPSLTPEQEAWGKFYARLHALAERIRAESATMTIEEHRARLQRNVLLLRGEAIERPVLAEVDDAE